MPFTAASLAQMKTKHARLVEQNDVAIREALAKAGAQALDVVDKRPGFKRRTGRLQEGTKARVTSRIGGGRLRITNSVRYAQWIEYGRGWVYPKTKPYLRFRVGGRWVTAKRVRPSKPYKFLYRAHRSAARVFEREMRERMHRISAWF